MRRKAFEAVMKLMGAHSAALQALGFSKWDVRDHSPVHALLVKVAFHLSLKLENEGFSPPAKKSLKPYIPSQGDLINLFYQVSVVIARRI